MTQKRLWIVVSLISTSSLNCGSLLSSLKGEGEDSDSAQEERIQKQKTKARIVKSELENKIPRFTRDDFIDSNSEEGSLWASSGQTNYYFTKNKVRNSGDLVSVSLEPEFVREVVSEIEKSLSPDERSAEAALLREEEMKKAMPPLGSTSPRVEGGEPAPAAVSSLQEPKAEPVVGFQKFIQLKSGDLVMGEILERYLNGNYKIKVTKRVPYKNGAPRTVSIFGIVRGLDINEDTDVVSSGRLYDYRIEVTT